MYPATLLGVMPHRLGTYALKSGSFVFKFISPLNPYSLQLGCSTTHSHLRTQFILLVVRITRVIHTSLNLSLKNRYHSLLHAYNILLLSNTLLAIWLQIAVSLKHLYLHGYVIWTTCYCTLYIRSLLLPCYSI